MVSFATLADFEFCLASRTEVPSGKIADLVVLTLDALKKEARGISRIEKRYVEILSRSIEAPGTIGGLLAELDPQSVSSDHEWRAIMSSSTPPSGTSLGSTSSSRRLVASASG